MRSYFSYLPNALTAIRLMLVPPIGFYIAQGWFELALALFLFAAVSDLVDGWLARRFAWESNLGRVLDPAADKQLLVVALATLTLAGVLPLMATLALVGRDLVLLCAAAIYRYLIGYLTPAPTFFGKSCSAAIMVLIVVVLLTHIQIPLLSELARWSVEFGLVLIVVTLSLASLVEYLWNYGTHGIALLKARRDAR